MDRNDQETKMSGIRVYKTGQRIIIEIDGAQDNFDQAILQFLSAFLNQPIKSEALDLQPVTQELSKPIKRETYSEGLILTEGAYKGISASQALHRYGEKALVDLFHYAKTTHDQARKEAVCTACKNYMSTALEAKKQSIVSEDEIDDFIRTVVPIIDVQKMLQMFTYQNLEDFLAAADYDEKKLAFDGVIDSLVQRGRQ